MRGLYSQTGRIGELPEIIYFTLKEKASGWLALFLSLVESVVSSSHWEGLWGVGPQQNPSCWTIKRHVWGSPVPVLWRGVALLPRS